jgi:hypothetical protein
MLYTERHKNLKLYKIGRGSITRLEKDENGDVNMRRYSAGDTILLTEKGAKQLHGNFLAEAIQREAKSDPRKIEVPDNWRDMRRSDLIALAATISDSPVRKTAEAVDIIAAYVGEEDGTDSE